MKRFIILIISALTAAIFACAYFLVIIPKFNSTSDSAAFLGKKLGNVSGSADGITQGLSEGADAGKEKGLSAEDTKVSIYECINETGRLEVLKASVSIGNFHEIGSDYAKLQIYYADVIFAVDLSKAVIEDKPDKIRIVLPELECSISNNEEKTETIAEYQRFFFSGSAEDGYTAAHNSRVQLDEKGTEAIDDYPKLVLAAEKSAIRNVKKLVGSVNVNDKEIDVVFDKEGE